MAFLKRPILIDGDIAKIPLTRNREAIIDASDAHLFAGKNWQLWPSGSGRLYGARKTTIAGKKITQRIHHLILPLLPGLLVDHKDGDGLNNRRENLRYASPSDNQRNKGPSYGRKHKGVYYRKDKSIYFVQLYIGDYKTLEAAKAAYNSALLKVFPEFGQTNSERPQVHNLRAADSK